MLIDDIQTAVREHGGPVADTFGDAFTREIQLSFDDLGMGLEDLIAQDARILSLYFNFTTVGKNGEVGK